ncbi:MAG TPA: formate dehydrogenase accessory sulfurtransferase FdhD [Methyloradius sp.]|nr:formate dehydrogenase accessory sulfurtransferase FdhD [Methyloradius sp.]
MVDATTSIYPVQKSHQGQLEALDDCVAEEVPIALIYNGISHAVMLATPQDLKEFALGFSLSEGILTSPKELYDIEIVHQEKGIELHLEVATERFQQLKERRRSMAGRTGCGLCGAESLEQALRIPEALIESNLQFDSAAIYKAHQAIQEKQELQALTGATHASAWVNPDGEVMMVREDVGRHNALDKLIGAMALAGTSKEGFVLTTSRASYEMVQKVITAGIPMLVAISAPTGLAIRIAQGCGLTLVGFARSHQHVIYSRADRVLYK